MCNMKNITLSIDDDLIVQARKYAHKCHTTLNQLIRDLLTQKVLPKRQNDMQRMFDLFAQHPPSVTHYRFKREDIYDV